MKIVDVKDPVYGTPDKSVINVKALFDNFKTYIAFSAVANDDTDHGKEIYANAIAGVYGTIGDYVPPPAPPTPKSPSSVSRAQGKMALIFYGKWDAVVAAVNAITDPLEKQIFETALYDTNLWYRDSPSINAMAAKLELTSEEVDELFILAYNLNF